MQPEMQFFIGKGGVGKSTVSAATAIHLSKASQTTLLVSMDPAHNQRDIFENEFSETPCPVNRFLAVKEVDTDFWIQKYLKETEKAIMTTYSYETAFNLDSYFNVLQFSPGLEEYALLLAFESIVASASKESRIVFDMAPTALSLRFLALPSVTLIWLEELMKLRKRIIAKKEIITKITIGKSQLETDKIRSRLDMMIKRYQHLSSLFQAAKTRINLVMNDDRMSFSEALRINETLQKIGMHIHTVVVSKAANGCVPNNISMAFKHQRIALCPMVPDGLMGCAALERYISANPEPFQGFS
jgi:arsenite-transporting ATPase